MHLLLNYLHKFVALEYCCSVKYQLAVFNVIFESSHVGLTERHEFLKQGGGLTVNPQQLMGSSEIVLCKTNQWQYNYSPVDLQVSWQIPPFWHNSLHTQYLQIEHTEVDLNLRTYTVLSTDPQTVICMCANIYIVLHFLSTIAIKKIQIKHFLVKSHKVLEQ